jgi:hypothetical protein
VCLGAAFLGDDAFLCDDHHPDRAVSTALLRTDRSFSPGEPPLQ